MRWYLNDVSLQSQYADVEAFLILLRGLTGVRSRFAHLGGVLYITRTLSEREIRPGLSLAAVLRQPGFRDQRVIVLQWLNQRGPFIEDDRLAEADDYFEFEGYDITDTGLGEAARRSKAQEPAGTFSFPGGALDFARSPLSIDHGIPEERLGRVDIRNTWGIDQLRESVSNQIPPPTNWRELIQCARVRFPRLWLPDSIYLNPTLAREPFDSVISEHTLRLLSRLEQYMAARRPDGGEEPAAQEIVRELFTGERAWFTGESETNRRNFRESLTFPDPEDPGKCLFCHWHGKISHRFFRLHFEWPVPKNAQRLKVLYLGPKITKG